MNGIERGNASPEVLALLHEAWPGVTVRSLRFEHNHNLPHPFRQDANGLLTVNLFVTGSEPCLVAAGLVTQEELDSLPACGEANRHGARFRRGKRATSVEFYMSESDSTSLDVADQRALDRMAEVTGSALWQPPSLSTSR